MVELANLNKSYEREEFPALTAVDNINLSINKGDLVFITGRSGSGKSTLLNMIAGLLRPTSGKVLINGVDLYSMEEAITKTRGAMIGYIPQSTSLFSNFSILDNMRLPFFLNNKRGDCMKHAMNLLEEMSLQNLAGRYPAQLSGGEKRRTAIARAFINDPDIIIADEPTNDLDEETAKEVMAFFKKNCHEGKTVILVTHEIGLSTYGNRIFKMSAGKLK